MELADPGLSAYVPAVQMEWLSSHPERRAWTVPGSLVFADVSGFTPLTEKLARRGKVGAEELTDILNQVFTGLLDEATSFGGDLLKFGGDALLLLFRDEGHERRAVAAAAAMQAALAPFRKFATNGGNVSLRMSVGVNSGLFPLFLVGGSHRELLVAGPAASVTAELEGVADAGQILLGPDTWSQVEPCHVGAVKAPGRLVRGRPEAERPGPRPADTTQAEIGVPAGLRPHLRTERDGGEHRPAILSFLQFKGTDDLLAERGPDAVADALDDLVTRTQSACERFDVCFLASDVDRNGGKLLMSTGAPRAGADDADRMLHALREIVEGDSVLAVRAGVNRGRAFAVDVGSPRRRTYAVMGDPTNLAARVMGKAEPGTVLATRSVTESLRDRFHLTSVPPFPVKGKTALVEASVVGPALGRQAAHRDLRFVGRDAELLALLETSRRARRDRREPPVMIVGEPGSGKSRLLDEVQLRVNSARTVRLAGTQYAASSPYLAVRGPLRQMIGAAATDPEEAVATRLADVVSRSTRHLLPLLPLLAVPVGVALPNTAESAMVSDENRPGRTRAAWVELLAAVAGDDGLLLVEDAQWLDQASAELISAVATGLAENGWVACVTRRPGPGGLEGGDDFVTMQLGPLTADAVTDLINDATQAEPLAPHVVAALVDRSGGNPLFVQELVDAVMRSATAELPDTVEGLIAARIDRLDPADRAVLNHAAVLGARIKVDVLERFAGSKHDVDASLARLADLLHDDGTGRLAFRQTLVREVAYEMLPFRVRREMHSRAGDLVLADVAADAEEFADLLSLHFIRAHRYAEAWHHARVAAARAQRSGAPVEAANLLQRALDAARHLESVGSDEVASVYHQLGGFQSLTGDFEAATASLQSARRLVPDSSPVLLELIQNTGRIKEQMGRYSEALRWLGRGINLAEALDDADRARARSGLLTFYGAVRLRQGRVRAAVRVLEEAVDACQRSGERRFLAHAYYLLDWAHTDLGSPEAERYRKLALPIYEELGDWAGQAKVLNNLGVDAYWEGRWDEAIAFYTRNQEAESRAGDLVQVVTASNNIGEILSDQGHLDEAVVRFEEALRTWRAARYPVGIALAVSNLGRAASRAGRFDQASHLLDEAVSRFDAAGMGALAVEAAARQAERLVLAGDPDGAMAALADVDRRLGAEAGHPALLALTERLRAYASAQQGKGDAALKHLDVSAGHASSASVIFESALTLEARYRIGSALGWDVPDKTSAEAQAIFDSLGVVKTPAVPLAEIVTPSLA